MPVTPPAYTAGSKLTAAGLTQDLPGEYRDMLNNPGIAETCPRWAVTSAVTLASGTLFLMPVYLASGQVISFFSWANGATAAVAPTHQWAALYNSSYAQLAITADKTSTAIGTNGTFSWGVATTAGGAASSFTTTYSGLYYVGLMIAVTTTMPTPAGAALANPVNGIAPSFGLSDASQTTPPAFPHTATTPSNHSTPYVYMYLS